MVYFNSNWRFKCLNSKDTDSANCGLMMLLPKKVKLLKVLTCLPYWRNLHGYWNVDNLLEETAAKTNQAL